MLEASFKTTVRPRCAFYLEIIIPSPRWSWRSIPFTDGIKMGSHSANRKDLHFRVSMTSHPSTLAAGKRSDICISVNEPLKLYRGLLLLIKWTFFTLFQSPVQLPCLWRNWRQWRPLIPFRAIFFQPFDELSRFKYAAPFLFYLFLEFFFDALYLLIRY